jgi:hypothetical protein
MSAIFCVRLGFVVLCLYALHVVTRRHREVVALLREFFFGVAAPENLGLLRIAVFSAMLIAAWNTHSTWFAALPIDFRELPRGWPWLEDEVLPIVMRHMHLLENLLVVSAALSVLGVLSRVTLPIATVLAVLVLGVPSFYFKISHGMQVQVLCAAVLSVSAAGDALSFDALVRRRRGEPPPAPASAYAIPLRFCWLLIGTMYLFPGLWKLWESGDLWISGLKLKIVMLQKWGEVYDVAPRPRLDRLPLLPALFGAATLVVEVGFFFALFHRGARLVAALSAAGFHVGVGLMMDIWFDFWWPMVVLLDFPEITRIGALTARLSSLDPRPWPLGFGPRPRAVAPSHSGAGAFVVGTTLVFSMFVAGLAPVDSWPVAVYPRFQNRQEEIPDEGYLFEFWKKRDDGELVLLKADFHPLDEASAYRAMWKALEFQRAGYESAYLRRVTFLAAVVKRNSDPSAARGKVVVYLTAFPLDPELRKTTPKRRERVAEVNL